MSAEMQYQINRSVETARDATITPQRLDKYLLKRGLPFTQVKFPQKIGKALRALYAAGKQGLKELSQLPGADVMPTAGSVASKLALGFANQITQREDQVVSNTKPSEEVLEAPLSPKADKAKISII